jgi:hypothetical protein
MLEIRQREAAPVGKRKYDLFRDGVIVTGAFASRDDCSFKDRETFRKIDEESCLDFAESLYAISLDWHFNVPELLSSIYIQAEGHICYYLTARGTLRYWKRPYSFTEYTDELVMVCESLGRTDLECDIYDSDEDPSCELKFCIDRSSRLCDEIAKTLNIVKLISSRAEEGLYTKTQANSLSTVFDFPEDSKVACEQYLLYFIQFLRDLGVEATSRLSHDAGRVLFTVVPNDKNQGLEKIRTALDIYINLPSAQLENVEEYPAIQRLSANIYHLKSQLSLTRAIVEAQETTIAHQRQMLSNDIMRESRQHTRSSSGDSEEILGGLISITRYDVKGITINLPELYRHLRDLFTKNSR